MASELRYTNGATSAKHFQLRTEVSVESPVQLASLLVVLVVALLLFRRTRAWIWFVLSGGALVTLILPLLMIAMTESGLDARSDVGSADGPLAVSTSIRAFHPDPFTAVAALGMLAYWISLRLKTKSTSNKAPQ
jgi:hypothetical protein